MGFLYIADPLERHPDMLQNLVEVNLSWCLSRSSTMIGEHVGTFLESLQCDAGSGSVVELDQFFLGGDKSMQFTLRGFSLRRSTGGCSGFLGDDFIEVTDDIEGNLVRSRLSWDFFGS